MRCHHFICLPRWAIDDAFSINHVGPVMVPNNAFSEHLHFHDIHVVAGVCVLLLLFPVFFPPFFSLQQKQYVKETNRDT